ncbi:MAG: hypothetical protein ACK521_11845 [bacterium]
MASDSDDSQGSRKRKHSAGRKSLGRACREFYEVSEQKKLVERSGPQQIRHRVCQKCKGRKIKSKLTNPDVS